MAVDPTATAPDCGRPSSPPWPPAPAYRSPYATCLQAPRVEQDRTPTLLPHLDELARTTPDQPRGDRPGDRRDHHEQRTQGPRRTRHDRLPHRRQDPRRTDESPRNKGNPHPTPLPRRMEPHL